MDCEEIWSQVLPNSDIPLEHSRQRLVGLNEFSAEDVPTLYFGTALFLRKFCLIFFQNLPPSNFRLLYILKLQRSHKVFVGDVLP